MSIFNKYINITFFVAVLILSFCSCKDGSRRLSKENYEYFSKQLDEMDIEKSGNEHWKVFYSDIAEAQGWEYDQQTWDIMETGNNMVSIIATTNVYFSKGDKIRFATVTRVCSIYSYPDCKILGYTGDEFGYDKDGKKYLKQLKYHYKLEGSE